MISETEFIEKLLKHYTPKELAGKKITDKRGGNNTIHTWDFELKGEISARQRDLLNALITERRKKKWAKELGIDGADGIPLSLEQIRSFFPDEDLESLLEDLVKKGYLNKSYPKVRRDDYSVQDTSLPVGYSITAGQLSCRINRILGDNDICPTLTSTDMSHIYIALAETIRPFSVREALRLMGFDDDFKIVVPVTHMYKQIGNSIVVNVLESIFAQIDWKKILDESYGE